MLVKELLENEYGSREYPSQIGTVTISAERNIYNALRKKYQLLAEESVNLFSAMYSEYHSCNDILDKAADAFQKSIVHSIDEMKKDFISMEQYDFDYDTIYQYVNEHGFLDSFYEAYEGISEQILEIYDDLEAKKQYREARKENRSRWVGGTYGGDMVDAYAQQARIATMNMAEGAAHKIFNMGENAVSTMHANKELKKIFDDPDTRSILKEGVFEAAFQLHYALIELLKNDGEAISWDYPGDEDCSTSQRLMNNLKSGAFPKEKEADICFNILELNPYNLELFEYFFEVFGDKDGKWGELAAYYGVDLEASKAELALNYVQEHQGETEEDAVKAKEMLLAFCEEISLPVSDDLKCIQYIDKRLADFDLQYRTVDGIVCATRVGADFAREELEQITAFMGQISAPTSESLLDYEEDLLIRKKSFEETFSSELKEKYLKQIDDYLADFDKKFCSMGLFKSGDRKEAGQERLLKLIKKCDVSSQAGVEQAYASMRELLPKVGLLEEEAQKTLDYLEGCKDELALQFVKQHQGITEEDARQAKAELLSYCESIDFSVNEACKCMQYIDKLLTDFDLKYRTVDEIVCKTREGADLAREELENITEFMGQIPAPTAESLLDYEKDLLAKKKIFEETFHSELKTKYLNQIDKYLTDFDKKFCSMGLFKKADRKQAGKDRALKYVKKLDCTTPEKVEEAYILLENFLPRVGITLEEAQEAVQYLDRKRESKNVLGSFGKLFKK